MQPASNRLRSDSQIDLGHAAIVNNDAGGPGEHGICPPDLFTPCPDYPADISPVVFQRFIEQGSVPQVQADVDMLFTWCVRNGESKALAYLLERANMRDINLGWGQRTDKELGVIADVLGNAAVLTGLSLACIKFSPASFARLCEALKSNCHLTSLDVSWNKLGVEGAQAITAVLGTNSALTDLNLTSTDLHDAGGIVLAHALTVNATLAKLNLKCNFLGPGAADVIFAALEGNKALTRLDLSGNGVQHGNANAIRQMLSKNSILTTLDLSGNKIGITDKFSRAKAVTHIVNGFERNAVLMDLTLEQNNLDQFIEASVPGSLGGRLHDLHQRNRSLTPISKRDAAVYAQPGLPVSLPLDAGELLSRFLLLVSSSMECYQNTMVDVHCALNASTRTGALAPTAKPLAYPNGRRRNGNMRTDGSSRSSTSCTSSTSFSSSSPVLPQSLHDAIQAAMLHHPWTALDASDWSGEENECLVSDPLPGYCKPA